MRTTKKFRGHDFFTKEPVYGQQICETEDGWDFWVDDNWIHCTDCAQFIGYDMDGREIYEGDEVVYLFNGTVREADMGDIFNCHKVLRLKEATE